MLAKAQGGTQDIPLAIALGQRVRELLRALDPLQDHAGPLQCVSHDRHVDGAAEVARGPRHR
eukprot:8409642-Lingulodinium_polyedra.AAC.1